MKQKPRLFSRGPLEIQLRVKSRERSPSKIVALVNFHFKSKHGASRDPAKLEWETYRMEMAEGLRRVVINRHEQGFNSGETILVVLGDRNSHFDAASAKILEGILTLNHFRGEGVCRLSKRGVPLCQAGRALPQRLFSVLLTDPEAKLLSGTFSFENTYSWLDDILMPAESLRFTWQDYDVEGNYASEVIYEPELASDHGMTRVSLNW